MIHLRKMTYVVLLILMMPALQASIPSVSAAVDRKPALKKPIDLNGCRLTLLKNREYFHALSERIRDARTQIFMAFFLLGLIGWPLFYPRLDGYLTRKKI